MDRKALFKLLTTGDKLSDVDVADLGLAALNSTIASTVEVKYAVGATGVRVFVTFTAMPVTVANTTGASFGSVKLFDFPVGRIRIEGGTVNFTAINWAGQDIGATGSGDFAIGTTATADATLSGTDVDLVASSAMLDPFVAGVGTGTAVFVKDTEFDGTSAAKDAYLNVIIDDADVADAASDIVLFTGTLQFDYVQSGDN